MTTAHTVVLIAPTNGQVCDAKVFETPEEAQAFVERADQMNAGNVTCTIVPACVAVEASVLLECLVEMCQRYPADHSTIQSTPWDRARAAIVKAGRNPHPKHWHEYVNPLLNDFIEGRA